MLKKVDDQKNKRKQKKPNGFKENQMDAKKADNDKENDKEDEEDNDKEDDKKVICPYQEILDLYHTTCQSYPKIRNLSKSRKQTIKSRYIEYKKDINIFKELFDKAENSSFLKGCNVRNWSANFDWMLKSSNMIKILEGNYKNKEENNGSTGQDNAKYSKVDFAKNRARETEREIDDSGLI